MSKIEFCNLLFRYISDGFTKVDIETDDFIYSFDFEVDGLFLSEGFFTLPSYGDFDALVYYKDVKNIVC